MLLLLTFDGYCSTILTKRIDGIRRRLFLQADFKSDMSLLSNGEARLLSEVQKGGENGPSPHLLTAVQECFDLVSRLLSKVALSAISAASGKESFGVRFGNAMQKGGESFLEIFEIQILA